MSIIGTCLGALSSRITCMQSVENSEVKLVLFKLVPKYVRRPELKPEVGGGRTVSE